MTFPRCNADLVSLHELHPESLSLPRPHPQAAPIISLLACTASHTWKQRAGSAAASVQRINQWGSQLLHSEQDFSLHPALPVCAKTVKDPALSLRDQTLSLWSGSTDSKTLDYQRTNPREDQIMRTYTKETTWIQDPTTSSTLWSTAHLNNKQNKYKPNHQQTGLPPHSMLRIRGKTNK